MSEKNAHRRAVNGGEPEKDYPGADFRRCKKDGGCKYLEVALGKPMCGYILQTGHPRPCPAGKNCTVFVKGKHSTWSIY